MESPAIFPIAQIAYSAISGNLLLNVFIKTGIPPLSTIEWTYVEVPDAIFVNPQADSSYKCGYESSFSKPISFGTNPLSMTC